MSEQSLFAPAEAMASFFDARAGGYNDHMHGNRNMDRLYEALAAQIPVTQEPIAILDLGCGTGMELAAVFRRAPNARITGLDISVGMLDILRHTYRERADQLTLMQASYVDWSYPQERFDYALSSFSLHHFLPQRKTEIYRNIHGALKRGGRYLESDYMVHEQEMQQALQEYHVKMATMDGGSGDYHIDIPFTPEVQVRLLRDAGFHDVTILLDMIDQDRPAAVLQAGKHE